MHCSTSARRQLGIHSEKGVPAIILSDKLEGPDRIPIPSLLAVEKGWEFDPA